MSHFDQERPIERVDLRCTELHDFSDLAPGTRFPMIVFAVAALLTIGHFAFNNRNIASAPVAQQSVARISG